MFLMVLLLIMPNPKITMAISSREFFLISNLLFYKKSALNHNYLFNFIKKNGRFLQTNVACHFFMLNLITFDFYQKIYGIKRLRQKGI